MCFSKPQQQQVVAQAPTPQPVQTNVMARRKAKSLLSMAGAAGDAGGVATSSSMPKQTLGA